MGIASTSSLSKRSDGTGETSAISKAYASIRADIVSGRLPPGRHLREEELAESVGVSRTPIRQALHRLAAEGLARILPNQGVFVMSWTPEDLRQIFDLRALLEGTAAGQAAAQMTAIETGRLRVLATGMEALARRGADDFLDRVAELNGEFHGIIMATARNERLVNSVVRTIEFPIVHRTFQRYRDADLRRSFNHHRELIDAFEARDGEWASAVMRAHVLAAKHVILSTPAAVDSGR